ncbi:MAG TPA: nuclear transport factor 2 family protein [Gaiellaceae bacterium]|nr:nuclear transport factor 2 family protein [Gaiellaceae bacterium]
MDTAAAAHAWIDGWTRGWENGDADAIGALYAPDAVFRSHPFREPERSGRDYALRAFEDEELVECRFGAPIVTGERAAVEYWAILRSEGEDETLAGIAVLRFRADGLVAEQRDYWVMQPGRRPPLF